MARTVKCVKLGRELPGLDKPPFPGELGQRIFENISKQAYDMWPAQSTLIINHYGLNMADPESRRNQLAQAPKVVDRVAKAEAALHARNEILWRYPANFMLRTRSPALSPGLAVCHAPTGQLQTCRYRYCC